MKPTQEDLKNRFYYHKPDAEALAMHQKINDLFYATAVQMVEICPEGRNLAMALSDLEYARMRANAAIATERK